MDSKINNDSNIELLDVSDWLKKQASTYCKDRFKPLNHPLVASGEATWHDSKTLRFIKKKK